VVGCAIEGVALACIPNPDDVLHTILVDAISTCAAGVPKRLPDEQPVRMESSVRS